MTFSEAIQQLITKEGKLAWRKWWQPETYIEFVPGTIDPEFYTSVTHIKGIPIQLYKPGGQHDIRHKTPSFLKIFPDKTILPDWQPKVEDILADDWVTYKP